MNIAKYNIESSYLLVTDEIAGAGGKVMLDLYNGSSDKRLLISGIYAIPKSDVAVTGVVSARFDIFRSSSAGTGGTANSYRSPANNAINIVPLGFGAPSLLNQGITGETEIAGIRARSAPTGGAAIKEWLFPVYVFPEETSDSVPITQGNNLLADTDAAEPLIIARNNGLMIQQGSVASVNSYLFKIIFSLIGIPSI